MKVWIPRTILRAGLTLVSLAIAFLTGLSRVSDNKHHPTDVLSGWLIGIITAGAIVSVAVMTNCHTLSIHNLDGYIMQENSCMNM